MWLSVCMYSYVHTFFYITKAQKHEVRLVAKLVRFSEKTRRVLGWYSETGFHIGMDRNFFCLWCRHNFRSQNRCPLFWPKALKPFFSSLNSKGPLCWPKNICDCMQSYNGSIGTILDPPLLRLYTISLGASPGDRPCTEVHIGMYSIAENTLHTCCNRQTDGMDKWFKYTYCMFLC